MVFSRISSALLRRNPFTSKFISSFSSSPSINFNLTSTISKFHPKIFSNPRITDFFQIRQYSVETPSLIDQEKSPDPKKMKLAEYNRRVASAYRAVDRAKYSKGRVMYWPEYQQDAELANNAINLALEQYDEVLSVLGEDERKDFEKARCRGRNLLLDMQEETMNDQLINFPELLKIWNKATFGEENPKGSGGTGEED